VHNTLVPWEPPGAFSTGSAGSSRPAVARLWTSRQPLSRDTCPYKLLKTRLSRLAVWTALWTRAIGNRSAAPDDWRSDPNLTDPMHAEHGFCACAVHRNR
jgi:ribosome modulation factor